MTSNKLYCVFPLDQFETLGCTLTNSCSIVLTFSGFLNFHKSLLQAQSSHSAKDYFHQCSWTSLERKTIMPSHSKLFVPCYKISCTAWTRKLLLCLNPFGTIHSFDFPYVSLWLCHLKKFRLLSLLIFAK